MTGKCSAGTPETYAAAFVKMLHTGHSIEELNKANHAALEHDLITLAHFQAAAKVLVNAIMKDTRR